MQTTENNHRNSMYSSMAFAMLGGYHRMPHDSEKLQRTSNAKDDAHKSSLEKARCLWILENFTLAAHMCRHRRQTQKSLGVTVRAASDLVNSIPLDHRKGNKQIK